MQESSNNKGLLIGTIIVAVLVFVALAWAIISAPSSPSFGTSKGGDAVGFSDETAPTIGPADAKVVVHLFSDLQCPACKNFEPATEYAINKYKDRIKFVWKDFPLMTVHPNARTSANAARCAEDQGKFWEYHTLLYTQQDHWAGQSDPRAAFITYANQLGMDEGAFSSCYDSRKNDSKVMDGVNDGMKNSVNATPTVFIENKRYNGLTADEWDRLLTEALAKS